MLCFHVMLFSFMGFWIVYCADAIFVLKCCQFLYRMLLPSLYFTIVCFFLFFLFCSHCNSLLHHFTLCRGVIFVLFFVCLLRFFLRYLSLLFYLVFFCFSFFSSSLFFSVALLSLFSCASFLFFLINVMLLYCALRFLLVFLIYKIIPLRFSLLVSLLRRVLLLYYCVLVFFFFIA